MQQVVAFWIPINKTFADMDANLLLSIQKLERNHLVVPPTIHQFLITSAARIGALSPLPGPVINMANHKQPWCSKYTILKVSSDKFTGLLPPFLHSKEKWHIWEDKHENYPNLRDLLLNLRIALKEASPALRGLNIVKLSCRTSRPCWAI